MNCTYRARLKDIHQIVRRFCLVCLKSRTKFLPTSVEIEKQNRKWGVRLRSSHAEVNFCAHTERWSRCFRVPASSPRPSSLLFSWRNESQYLFHCSYHMRRRLGASIAEGEKITIGPAVPTRPTMNTCMLQSTTLCTTQTLS